MAGLGELCRERSGLRHAGEEEPLVDALPVSGHAWKGSLLELFLQSGKLGEGRIRVDRLLGARRAGLGEGLTLRPAVVIAAAVLWCGSWLMITAGLALARLNRDFYVVPGHRRTDDSAPSREPPTIKPWDAKPSEEEKAR